MAILTVVGVLTRISIRLHSTELDETQTAPSLTISLVKDGAFFSIMVDCS